MHFQDLQSAEVANHNSDLAELLEASATNGNLGAYITRAAEDTGSQPFGSSSILASNISASQITQEVDQEEILLTSIDGMLGEIQTLGSSLSTKVRT